MARFGRLSALVVMTAVGAVLSPAMAGPIGGATFDRSLLAGAATASPATSVAATATTTTTATTAATTTRITLDGVTVGLPAGGHQVVTVNHTTGYKARVTLWQRGAHGWRVLARSVAGRIGYDGLVPAQQRRQASGATPLGTFGLLWAFGTHPKADDWHLSYRMTRAGDYWVEDNASAYYNRYREKADGGFRWWLPTTDWNSSEHLRSYPIQYEYSVVISFNYWKPVRHRGAGIFLHVNGPGATAGCVSAPRWFIQRVMATLDPDQRPVIAIGR